MYEPLEKIEIGKTYYTHPQRNAKMYIVCRAEDRPTLRERGFYKEEGAFFAIRVSSNSDRKPKNQYWKIDFAIYYENGQFFSPKTHSDETSVPYFDLHREPKSAISTEKKNLLFAMLWILYQVQLEQFSELLALALFE